MDLNERRRILADIKAKTEEKRLKKVKERSVRYSQTPGKILWGFCLSVTLFCTVFVADNWMSTTYSSHEIQSYSKDKVDLIKGGFVVSSTFYWVYIGENSSLGIHMHKNEFNQIRNLGKIELGTTPLFNIPVNFRIPNSYGDFSFTDIEKNYNYTMVIPIFLIIISFIWLFAKPQKELQWIMYGNFVIIIVPTVFAFLIFKIIDFVYNIGIYEIDVSGINL